MATKGYYAGATVRLLTKDTLLVWTGSGGHVVPMTDAFLDGMLDTMEERYSRYLTWLEVWGDEQQENL